MEIKVNNKPVQTGAGTLKQLAEELALPDRGVAVAVGGKMVKRCDWDSYLIEEGISILVIKAACGG